MNLRRLGLILGVVALLLVVALSLGCNGHGILKPPDGGAANGGGNPGNGTVPLGTMRQLQDGDTWTYNVTGTFVADAGGSTPLTPAEGVLTYAAATQAPFAAMGAGFWAVDVPLVYGDTEDASHSMAALVQQANGRIDLVGYTPVHGALAPEPMADGPLQGPDPATFPTMTTWEGSAEIAEYGTATLNITNHGVEDVTVPAGTFTTYHWTGTKSIRSFVIEFEGWGNPQLGNFVKLIATTPLYGGAITATIELKNTSVPLT